VRFASKLLFAPALLALTAAAEPPPNVLFTVPAAHRLIEGIATDGRTIWLSSVLDRTILERQGANFRTIALPADGQYPLAIAWDAARHWLWIATDCPDLPGVAKCAEGALIAIDHAGKVRAKASVDPLFHPGDVSASAGRIFVSDSQTGAVYGWNAATQKLDVIVPVGVGRSAQQSVRIGNQLFVADYRDGIARIDLATKMRTLLPLTDGTPLNGVDGLTRAGGWFVGVRNGAKIPVIVAFKTDEAHVNTAEVLARGGVMKDPTQVVVAGDHLLLVGEAGWDAAAAGAARTAPAPILSLPLPH
jgi:hypothetical protein